MITTRHNYASPDLIDALRSNKSVNKSLQMLILECLQVASLVSPDTTAIIHSIVDELVDIEKVTRLTHSSLASLT